MTFCKLVLPYLHEIAPTFPSFFPIAVRCVLVSLPKKMSGSKLAVKNFHQTASLGIRSCHGIWLCAIGPWKEQATKWKFLIFAHVSQEFLWWQRRVSVQPAAGWQARLKHCFFPAYCCPISGHRVTLDYMLAKNTSPFSLFFCDCALQWMLTSICPAQ